jgi:enoyl-CoA hydratase/carnithine racemase
MAEIELTREDGITTILLNRPARRNALNLEMMARLGAVLQEIEQDVATRAVILTGAGNVFCSGLDLGAMGESPTVPALERSLVDEVLQPLEVLSKPTIAALNGDALAGGCELALHCDLRIAVPQARLGMPVARIGIVVPYPLILKLIDTVGSAITSELLFTAEPISAERALALAMVNRIVASDQLAREATQIATAIARNAPLAVLAMKRAILAGRAQRADPPPDDVRRAAEAARSSEDAREGLRAILEKRKPNFSGR